MALLISPFSITLARDDIRQLPSNLDHYYYCLLKQDSPKCAHTPNFYHLKEAEKHEL